VVLNLYEVYYDACLKSFHPYLMHSLTQLSSF